MTAKIQKICKNTIEGKYLNKKQYSLLSGVLNLQESEKIELIYMYDGLFDSFRTINDKVIVGITNLRVFGIKNKSVRDVLRSDINKISHVASGLFRWDKMNCHLKNSQIESFDVHGTKTCKFLCDYLMANQEKQNVNMKDYDKLITGPDSNNMRVEKGPLTDITVCKEQPQQQSTVIRDQMSVSVGERLCRVGEKLKNATIRDTGMIDFDAGVKLYRIKDKCIELQNIDNNNQTNTAISEQLCKIDDKIKDKNTELQQAMCKLDNKVNSINAELRQNILRLDKQIIDTQKIMSDLDGQISKELDTIKNKLCHYKKQSIESFKIQNDELLELYGTGVSNSSREQMKSALRHAVWEVYINSDDRKGLCFCCRLAEITVANYHCGHVVSIKHGGKDHLQNLRPICMQCNLSMGAMNMYDFVNNYGFWFVGKH